MSKTNGNLGYRVALGGLLVAMMLILGYVETLLQGLIPMPVPGIKLGISNGVLLFALYLMDIRSTVILMVLKVLLSGLLFGNPMTMLFAFCGGALSLIGMIPLSRVKGLNIVTVSMVGAVLHNVGQIIAAAFVMSEVSPSILLRYLAVLMLVALVTGAATGVLAREIISRLRHVVDKGMGR
jgi:heptaprenyl diphosphate synthase